MNPGEIPMGTVFFSSYLDTVAATHDKNRFHMCELIHLIVWEAKKWVMSHAVVSYRVAYV